jgi:hypothetical protein
LYSSNYTDEQDCCEKSAYLQTWSLRQWASNFDYLGSPQLPSLISQNDLLGAMTTSINVISTPSSRHFVNRCGLHQLKPTSNKSQPQAQRTQNGQDKRHQFSHTLFPVRLGPHSTSTPSSIKLCTDPIMTDHLNMIIRADFSSVGVYLIRISL